MFGQLRINCYVRDVIFLQPHT